MKRFVFALALVASPAAALASDLVGANYTTSDSPLLSINQGTGAATAIGMMGRQNVGDLTSNPASGVVWGIDLTSGNNSLVTINPVTGAVTSSLNIVSNFNITSIAFDSVTGVLYGNAAVAFNPNLTASDILYRIDPVTGVATFVGNMGVLNVFALGFDNNGVLFGISDNNTNLYSFSTTNADPTLRGNIDVSGHFDLAFRPEDNTMFVSSAFSGSLYTMNPANAQRTLVGAYGAPGTNVAGLAFIPTPGAAGLLALAGLSVARRRR